MGEGVDDDIMDRIEYLEDMLEEKHERVKKLEEILQVAEAGLIQQAIWLSVIFNTVKDIGKFLGNNVKMADSDLKGTLIKIKELKDDQQAQEVF